MVAVKTWRALGTSASVVTANPSDLERAVLAVHEVIGEVDQALSRFREDSELNHLNASAGRRVAISPLLARAIEVALEAARSTNGAVDPTIGSAIRTAGYDDDFSRLPADGGPVALHVMAAPGWQAIRYQQATRSVLIPAGVELDFGSTGKALAADLAASAASLAIDSGVMVSLGGDIATAGVAPAGGWRVLIAEDSQVAPNSDGQVLCMSRGGIATSSTTVRRWRRGEAVLHHIIDPETGMPSTGCWRTVTVLAPSCVEANVAATAAIVRGDNAVSWLKARRFAARLVENDGTVHYFGPWPDPHQVVA